MESVGTLATEPSSSAEWEADSLEPVIARRRRHDENGNGRASVAETPIDEEDALAIAIAESLQEEKVMAIAESIQEEMGNESNDETPESAASRAGMEEAARTETETLEANAKDTLRAKKANGKKALNGAETSGKSEGIEASSGVEAAEQVEKFRSPEESLTDEIASPKDGNIESTSPTEENPKGTKPQDNEAEAKENLENNAEKKYVKKSTKKKKKKKKDGADDTSKKSKKKKKKKKDPSKVKKEVLTASDPAIENNDKEINAGAKQTENSEHQPHQTPSKHRSDIAFESAWREADLSKHSQRDDESMSYADSILYSTASSSHPPPQHQYDLSNSFRVEGNRRDVRRQTASLAAEETRRVSGRKLTNPAFQSRSIKTSSTRLPDYDDGAEQPVNGPARLFTGKEAYIEGVKARSIMDEKIHRPGAFQIQGIGPADDEDSDIVTANVAHEDEKFIEERVMQRILQETAKASVIRVEHGGHSNRYEDPIAEAERQAELEIYKPQGIKEKMFGDGKNTSLDIGAAPDDYIQRRDHLPWTAKLNSTTNLWVASVQTNQKAWESSQYMYEESSLELKRSIQTFVGSTEQEAYEIGLALAPPLMHSLEENPICCLCKTKFAILKRPCNCRNCGVVICSGCACTWSSKQIPTTYNTERRSNVSVCLACDWLAGSFQQALLTGDWSKAQSLYQTGNVNLRSLYGTRRRGLLGNEAMYPVHMAIRGGNLSLVKWLLFDHYCPLHRRTGKDIHRKLLLTSKGRSPIDMALEQPRPEILKFLVSNQGVSLMEGAKKESRNCLSHLMCLIELIPESMLANVTNDTGLPLQEMALSTQSADDRTLSFANRDHLGSF